MTTPTLESFFSGGGGKSLSWKDRPIGTTYSGTIKAVHPPQQQTDPVDQKPQFKKNGEPKMSVRIDLATNDRDPSDPDDDGSRSLYVQGWMQGAIGDALRKAGRQGPPEVGAQISVTLTERTPNDNPALAPINKFAATYVSPSGAATGQFFDQGAQNYAQQQAPQQPVPQPSFNPGGGYVQQPQAQPQYGAPGSAAQVPQQQAQPEPQRPATISEQAWAAMDPATRIAVSTTMSQMNAGGPPF